MVDHVKLGFDPHSNGEIGYDSTDGALGQMMEKVQLPDHCQIN